jgi:hypothetical protein
VRLLWRVFSRRAAADSAAADSRALFVAVVFSASAILSVYHQPNYSHFGAVGAIWLSLIGESVERLVALAEGMLRTRLVGALVTAGVLVLLVLQARRALAEENRGSPKIYESAFGRIQFRSQSFIDDAEEVRKAVQAAGAKEIFVYPAGAWVYLTTQTSNPTRFQHAVPGMHSPENFAEIQATLERRRVPFVVRTFWFWGQEGDPLRTYLAEHYEGVPLKRTGGIPSLTLLRRKADDGPAPP